jgi:hypothetical protein
MLFRLVVAIVLALATLSNSGCNGQGSPVVPGPSAGASSLNLSGLVLETTPSGSRPVDGVTLFVKVQSGNSWGHFGSTMSDAQGRYAVSNLSPGTVYMEASWNTYRQPCFASMDLRRDAVLDIEVISEATLLALGSSSLKTLSGRMVSGFVFEPTAGGGRPVAGAELQVWVGDWLYGASTSTDASGRYLFCRVPRELPVNVYTNKEGYREHIVEILPGGDTTLDIQLERR